MRILFKIPSRERPAICEEVLKGWIDKQVTREVDYLVSIDDNDPENAKYLDLVARLRPEVEANGGMMVVVSGVSKNKIDAVNRDMDGWSRPWDVLVLGSDDMFCAKDGWDRTVMDAMAELPPGCGAPFFPDGNQTKLLTFSILGRKLYDAFGYIYHPAYQSLWADNEFHESVVMLGVCKRFQTILAKHRHCTVAGGLPRDSLYKRNEALYHADRKTYQARKRHKFDVMRVKRVIGK